MNFNSCLFKYWPLRNYDAITLPWGIYFRQSENKVDPEIIQHELVHMEQRKRIGTFKFYILYLSYYVRNLLKYRNHDEAYRNIPFEVEAYQKQWVKNVH